MINLKNLLSEHAPIINEFDISELIPTMRKNDNMIEDEEIITSTKKLKQITSLGRITLQKNK